MLEQLKANIGKQLELQLIDGTKVNGKLAEANPQYFKMETERGFATIPFSAIMIVWEGLKRELTEEKMDYLANKLRSDEQSRIACTSAPGFNCANQYVCIPPDYCAYTFSCPGRYTPSQPQGGCNQFQFYQPCGFNYSCRYNFYQPCYYNFYQPCGFRFYFQPCGYRFTQPCRYLFQQPCRYEFQQPCRYEFQEPCRYQFQQPCQYNFGSQCTTPGGFTCPGQAFYGIAPGAKKDKQGKKE